LAEYLAIGREGGSFDHDTKKQKSLNHTAGQISSSTMLETKKLVGLPKEYTPAELDLKDFRIRIKDHAMAFSPQRRKT
jgi:hypothetical protein